MNEEMEEGFTVLSVRGLGSIEEINLPLGRLTVLIGPNGSGKSNILKGLSLVSATRKVLIPKFVGRAGGASVLLRYGPKRTRSIEIDLMFKRESKRYHFQSVLEYAAGDTLFPKFSVEFSDIENSNQSDLETMKEEIREETASILNNYLNDIHHFHFHDTSVHSLLRANARRSDDRVLRSDGANVGAYLLRLSESGDEADAKAWKRINYFVRKVAPAVKSLDPVVVGRDEDHVRLDWVDDQGERFGVHQLSDGTLRAIALITALAQPITRLPKFISIDEPELGLHPAAIGIIARLARSISHRTQVLFATQSTTFLNHFVPEEVVVVERKDGATQIKSLSSEDLSEWLEEYTLAEIYEKGVIGGRP